MGKYHDAVVRKPRKLPELLHPSKCLSDIIDLRIQWSAGKRPKFLVVMVVAVDADRQPVAVCPEERYHVRFTAIVVPRNKGDCCVEIMPPHLLQQIAILKVSVGFPQPRIVNRDRK